MPLAGIRHRAPFWAAFLLFLFLAAVPAWGAEFKLESETLLRFFERNNDFVAPAYEYMRADVGDPETEGLAFHLYGWGRADLAGSNFFREDTAGELLYGYLEYTRAENNFQLKLGRQYIFEGVSNLAVDGVQVSGDITPWFSASAYAGWPVALDSEQGRSGDSAFGGRLAHHLGTLYEIGVSYRQVNNDDNLEDERVGIDLSAALPAGVNFFGQSSYNLDTEGWAEHFYELRFKIADFYLRPYFEHFRYEDYFNEDDFSANPFRFLANTGETLTIYGGDVQWVKLESWELGLRFKYYDYDERDDSSQFYSGLATWHGEDLTQAGGELGIMDGEFFAPGAELLHGSIHQCGRLPHRLSSGRTVRASVMKMPDPFCALKEPLRPHFYSGILT